MLILRNALLGMRRFQDFEQRLGIPPSTLARRLKLLCKQELLQRRRAESSTLRDEYVPTDKGMDLLPVLLSMAAWGNRWLAPKGAPLVPVDPSTGAQVEPVVVDKRTGRRLSAGAVAIAAGPGASKRLRRSLERPAVFGGCDESETNQPETP